MIQPNQLTNKLRPASLLRNVLAVLSSLKLAITLIAVLAAVLATATVLESRYGRAYSQWYIYRSPWFIGLLALLGVSVFCAAAVRWPWKRHQVGFVMTHVGLLVLLGGSILSFTRGLEGQVTLVEGQEPTWKMTVPGRDQITAQWVDRPEEPPYQFSFAAGPVSWSKGRTLNFGKIDDIGARLLHYYAHARPGEAQPFEEKSTGSSQRRQIVFEPVATDNKQKMQPPAAVEVELNVAGKAQTVWLQSGRGSQMLSTPNGVLMVIYGPAERPLGFSLKLERFQRGTNPGGVGNATYASVVQLTDPHKGINKKQDISMNEPLTHNGLTFYQQGFNEDDPQTASSTLMVGYDPGRPVIYAGCLVVCLGIGIMFYMRVYFFKRIPQFRQSRPLHRGVDQQSISAESEQSQITQTREQAAEEVSCVS